MHFLNIGVKQGAPSHPEQEVEPSCKKPSSPENRVSQTAKHVQAGHLWGEQYDHIRHTVEVLDVLWWL